MPLTIYSSWRGLLSAVASPLVLLALGGYAMGRVGAQLAPALIIMIGLILGAIVLFDYPRKSRFSGSGVERICLLRNQLIPWESIDAIQRTRPDRPRARLRSRSAGAWSSAPHRAVGGLVAVVGRRRYLLVNQIEGRIEYDELAASLGKWSPGTSLRAERPPESAPPSYLHRPRHEKG